MNEDTLASKKVVLNETDVGGGGRWTVEEACEEDEETKADGPASCGAEARVGNYVQKRQDDGAVHRAIERVGIYSWFEKAVVLVVGCCCWVVWRKK